LTEQKKVEANLQASNKTLEDIIDFFPEATFVIDNKRRVIAWNKAIEVMTGVKKKDIIGKDDYEYAIPFYGERRPILIDLLFEEKPDIEERYDFVKKVGDTYFVEVFIPNMYGGRGAYVWASASRLYDDKGNITGAIETIRDITEIKKAQTQIKVEKDRLQTILDNMPLGVILVEKDNAFSYVNPEFIKLFGYDTKDIQKGRDWIRKAYPDKEYREMVATTWKEDIKRLKQGDTVSRIFKVTCRDGKEKEVRFQTAKLESGEILVVCEDITEHTKMEQQLAHAQKMEAIGVLAGGVAHDFNNLLMGIQGNVSLMLFKLDSSHPNYKRLTHIEDLIRNGAMLTRQLLEFARGAQRDIRPININEIARKTAEMFGRMKKEITIHGRYEEGLYTIDADAGQIEQILMNLFINAWQAMAGGGEIFVETSNVYLDKKFTDPHQVTPGRYIKISVTDTGSGMDEKTKEKIFEPFFTTKEVGKGTGLGLSTVYGIVKGYKGIINVYSEPGKGTTFNIYLPASQKISVLEARLPEGMDGGQETVLLIDDEEVILNVGKDLLEALGYRVYTAKGGQKAVEIYKEKGKDIDLIILDMIMPGKGGEETFEELHSINPDVRVILASGYSMDGAAERVMKKGCRGFIQKPFNLNELSNKIREVLNK
ncbi:MAG: PAS domain S-box protein, partial [Syntrophorhabdaceae bacterium]|nr:PAS domain S-box protein [Syntrophorhabdaceae bacterium]